MSKQIVTGIYEAFGRGDLAGVLSALADNVVWEMAGTAPFAGRRDGLAGVQGFFVELMGAVKIEMFEVDAVVGDGELVVVMGRERCRATRTRGELRTALGARLHGTRRESGLGPAVRRHAGTGGGIRRGGGLKGYPTKVRRR
jgi:ketosteroid isomerase-like protein